MGLRVWFYFFWHPRLNRPHWTSTHECGTMKDGWMDGWMGSDEETVFLLGSSTLVYLLTMVVCSVAFFFLTTYLLLTNPLYYKPSIYLVGSYLFSYLPTYLWMRPIFLPTYPIDETYFPTYLPMDETYFPTYLPIDETYFPTYLPMDETYFPTYLPIDETFFFFFLQNWLRKWKPNINSVRGSFIHNRVITCIQWMMVCTGGWCWVTMAGYIHIYIYQKTDIWCVLTIKNSWYPEGLWCPFMIPGGLWSGWWWWWCQDGPGW
jgi:hypothetical protein